MAEDTVTVTVALTPRGYRGVLLHLSALKLRLVVPLLAFFGFAALGAGFNTQAFAVLSTLVAVLLTVWGYIAWNVNSPSRAGLYEPVAYEFAPERIVYAGAEGAGTITWEQVRRWRHASGHYLLFVAGASYLLVPEADLAVADVDRFESLLRTSVKKGPRRRF